MNTSSDAWSIGGHVVLRCLVHRRVGHKRSGCAQFFFSVARSWRQAVRPGLTCTEHSARMFCPGARRGGSSQNRSRCPTPTAEHACMGWSCTLAWGRACMGRSAHTWSTHVWVGARTHGACTHGVEHARMGGGARTHRGWSCTEPAFV